MLHIMLTEMALANDPTDPLHRTYYGWDPDASIEENWANNHGYYALGARADREQYVLFSLRSAGTVVMAGRIDEVIDATGKPGKRIIEGEPLPDDHPVHQAYVGKPTPERSLVRNPVTYPPLTAEGLGRPCACGCGTEVFAGEFVRGHEQTALHQRIARIGSISKFLSWFDEMAGGAQPTVGIPDALLIDAQHLLDLWDMLPGWDESDFWSQLNKAVWGQYDYFEEKMQTVPRLLRRYLDGSQRTLYTAQYVAQYALLFFDKDRPEAFELLDRVVGYSGGKGLAGRRWAADVSATAWRLYVPGRAGIQRGYLPDDAAS
jgi:hypothetical protein